MGVVRFRCSIFGAGKAELDGAIFVISFLKKKTKVFLRGDDPPDEYFRCKAIAFINYCKEMSLEENDFEIQFNFIVMHCKQEGSMCV